MNIDAIITELNKELKLSEVSKNEPMSLHTSFRIGGPSDVFVTTKSIEDVQFIMKFAKVQKIPLTVIGNGSNVLVTDKGIRGITLNLNLGRIEYLDNDEVLVECGVKNGFLATKLAEKGLTGFEFMAGIPGTIGGAVYMNAGCFGQEIKDILSEVTYICDGKLITESSDKLDLRYRHSKFLGNKDCVIVSAKLKLHQGNEDDIKAKIKDLLQEKLSTQPYDLPTAGSAFKRGSDFITAQLIDEAGLKGLKIGGAEISTKHAGFIVNSEKATAQDVIDLMEKVKQIIFEKYGKKIEAEIEILGEK